MTRWLHVQSTIGDGESGLRIDRRFPRNAVSVANGLYARCGHLRGNGASPGEACGPNAGILAVEADGALGLLAPGDTTLFCVLHSIVIQVRGLNRRRGRRRRRRRRKDGGED